MYSACKALVLPQSIVAASHLTWNPRCEKQVVNSVPSGIIKSTCCPRSTITSHSRTMHSHKRWWSEDATYLACPERSCTQKPPALAGAPGTIQLGQSPASLHMHTAFWSKGLLLPTRLHVGLVEAEMHAQPCRKAGMMLTIQSDILLPPWKIANNAAVAQLPATHGRHDSCRRLPPRPRTSRPDSIGVERAPRGRPLLLHRGLRLQYQTAGGHCHRPRAALAAASSSAAAAGPRGQAPLQCWRLALTRGPAVARTVPASIHALHRSRRDTAHAGSCSHGSTIKSAASASPKCRAWQTWC